jgi:hypothetical protein
VYSKIFKKRKKSMIISFKTAFILLAAIFLTLSCGNTRSAKQPDVENASSETEIRTDNISPGSGEDKKSGAIKDNSKTEGEKNACKKDEDCVKASCCHAAACVNSQNAPSCKNIMCTMDCRADTMDCGQGSCKCVNGQCSAVITRSLKPAVLNPE